jgi:hypothetical protein
VERVARLNSKKFLGMMTLIKWIELHREEEVETLKFLSMTPKYPNLNPEPIA